MVTAKELGFKEGEATVYEGTVGKLLRYTDAAPKIKAAGEIAAGTDYVLGRRCEELEAFASKYQNKRWTRENFEKECPFNVQYFETGTAAYATENFIAIQHKSPQLTALTPKTQIYHGSLEFDGTLSGEKIILYSGEVLKKLKQDKLLNTPLTEYKIVGTDSVHPIWKGYAEGNSNIIRQLVPLAFKALCDIYNLKEGMGTYFAEDYGLRVVTLDMAVGDKVFGAIANRAILGDYNVNLVGLKKIKTIEAAVEDKARKDRARVSRLLTDDISKSME